MQLADISLLPDSEIKGKKIVVRFGNSYDKRMSDESCQKDVT